MKNLTICLITCGEETESRCLSAIEGFKDQVVLQEVRNVCPQIKALNQMVDQVETPYLIPLDADIVLYQNAWERIRVAIDRFDYDPQWHSILFPLYDTLTERNILALKLMRTKALKEIPFEESATPDINHFRKLTDAGWTCIQRYIEKQPIGDHVVQGHHFCYNKYRDVYLTLRSHGRVWDNGVFFGGETLLEKAKKHFEFFICKFLKTDNPDYMSCIAGMADGLTAPVEHRSKSLGRKEYAVSLEDAYNVYMIWYLDQLSHVTTFWF